MSEDEKKALADAADMVVRGYAYTRKENNIFVVNLNVAQPHTMIISEDGQMLESSMDPIEQAIALEIWDENREFVEESA